QARVAVDGIDHVQSIRTRHRRSEISRRKVISLRDAMNRSTKAYRVLHLVKRAAVVAPEKVALNGLPRSVHARPQSIRSDLHMKRRRRQNQRIAQLGIDRV